MQPVTLDFETYPIQPRPDYPPAPVGMALHADGMEARYISWGHVNGRNNGTEAEAKELLWRVWCDPTVPLLAHNMKFDMGVAVERWGFPMLPWQRIHDTTFLAFLADPHSRSAGLKQLCENLLDMPPEERDVVAEWVVAHKRELEAAYPHYPTVTKKRAGAWIFAAPAELVEPYAIGDVVRARALFDHLHPLIERHGMGPAYDRERQVLPILMENEREGMRVDPQLEEDCELYGKAFAYAEDWLRRELRASGLNFDADQDVAAILLERGIVRKEDFPRTKPTDRHKDGQLSVSKDNLLPELFTGPNGAQVASMLGYRNRLKTCLSMFMEPWRDQARVYGGRITTNWNQIRGYGDGGTRTGRPSTNSHNFLNISKNFEGRDDQYTHPDFSGLPKLPLCRKYILPDDGEVFLHRDFSGQELRVFGHFEQGALWDQYQADAALDVHNYVGQELMQVAGREIERTSIKVMNFQAIYGGGVPALQRKLRCSVAEAKALKAFHDQALPGRKVLNQEIERIIRRGEPIRTLGGRLYFEEPRGADGRSKVYKLLNYLVQGSAADLTKQALIDWYNHPDRTARFLVTVYDEINISAPFDAFVQQMAILKETMEAPRMSVPMLSDGKAGERWGELEKYNDSNPVPLEMAS